MKIDKLVLGNFRNFESISFNFPTSFTVVIGENGKGKSTILQGLKLAAATFLLGIDESDKYHIQKEDIRRIDLNHRFVALKNCFFEVNGVLNDQQLVWKRTLSSVGSRTDYKDAADIINIAKELDKKVNVTMEESVDLPVLGFFSTARLWSDSKQTFNLKKKGFKLKDGYARCLDERSDKKSPMEWIKSNYYKNLKHKNDLGLFDAVMEAINLCIPNWCPTEWDEDTDDLAGNYTDENGDTSFIPLYYLSDGLRTMASMAAEIAYRCVLLNPHHGKDAVKKSKGVILIDEIDMHLHPMWQQRVVNDLKTAFPNIQFVATTHSPFIVQSLKAEELINLEAGVMDDPDKMSIQDVSSHIMKVEPRSLEYQKKYDLTSEYLELLSNLKDNKKEIIIDLKNKLDEVEKAAEINDPAVAAFLKMNRLAALGNEGDNNIKPI